MPKLTAEQWVRLDQIRELVKQEGDARCEAVFDDVCGEVNLFREALKKSVEMLDHYGPEPGHSGSCIPSITNCDMLCVEWHHFQNDMREARSLVEK